MNKRTLTDLQQRQVVTLQCGHAILFRNPAPKEGEKIGCQQCAWQLRAVVTRVPEYLALCRSGVCRWGRRGGGDLDATILAGKMHMRDYPGHKVKVVQGSERVCQVVNDLPVPGTPRWHAEHRTHASMLRKFIERL